MKGIITVISVVFYLGSFAQIEVVEYDKKLTSEVSLAHDIPFPTANSSCGLVTISVSEQIFSGGCPGNLVQTFTFSDGCGNSATAERYISLRDSFGPVFDFSPANLEVGKLSKAPAAPKLTAQDDSGYPVDIKMTETQGEGELIRIWTATDVCGNQTTIEQVVALKSL